MPHRWVASVTDEAGVIATSTITKQTYCNSRDGYRRKGQRTDAGGIDCDSSKNFLPSQLQQLAIQKSAKGLSRLFDIVWLFILEGIVGLS
jgi:hypothetical protein